MTKNDPSIERVTIAQIAEALHVTKRNAELRAAKDSWPFNEEPVRGGKRRLYAIDDLPGDIQAALAKRLIVSSSADRVSAPPGEQLVAGLSIPAPAHDARAAALAAQFEARSEKRKSAARTELAIVQQYRALVARGFKEKHARAAAAGAHQVDGSTVWRLWRCVRSEPPHLWLYCLGGDYPGRTARAPMSAEAWEALKADYLRPERPTAKACINRLRRAAEAKGWAIPKTRTLERRLAELPRSLTVLARHGSKAAAQLYPAQVRDKRALSALAIVNGDGYKHNLWVEFPDGEIVRAKTWYWQDVYSNAVLAWRTDKTEHTDMIRLSFGDVVEQYGIPERVVLDNTLAAANKTMSGGVKHRFRFRVRDDEPLGVFPLLIGPDPIIWATPGHGQAKPVERAFGIGGVGEIVDKAPEFSGAWTGGSPLDKPDYDGKTRAIPLAELEAVIAREIAAWNAHPGRRSAIARGRSYWNVFHESYQAAPIRRATEAQRRLWLLATEPVRAASRDGAISLDAGRAAGMANRYWSEALIDYAGRQVVAKFDPKRLHEGVHVYTLDGRYITFAVCYEAKGFADRDAGREHNRARRQFVKGAKLQLAAERRMGALEAARTYAAAGPGTIPAPAIARGAVVRGEFRDPLERPVPHAESDTPEEAAARAALAEELRATRPSVEQDEWAPYRRCYSIEQRLAAGEPASEEERAWMDSYRQSTDYRTFAALAVDFPEKLEEPAE